MMIFFTIFFSLLIINVVLLLFSVNKLPKTKAKSAAIYQGHEDALKTKEEVKNEEYDVVFKEAI